MTILSKLNISDKSKTPVFASPEELLRNRILNSLETQIAEINMTYRDLWRANKIITNVAAGQFPGKNG